MLELMRQARDASMNLDRNSRLTDLENTAKFLEAKILKIEKIISSIPASFVIPKKVEHILNKDICKRCVGIDKHYEGLIKSNKQKIANIQEAMEKEKYEGNFLLKRVVAVYGNKALIDLMNHTENTHWNEERREQYLKVKPHF